MHIKILCPVKTKASKCPEKFISHCTRRVFVFITSKDSVIKILLFPQSMLEEKGLEALNLRVPFDEKAALEKNVNYLVRSLEVRDCQSRLSF